MYGLGAAEAELGRFLRGRRDESLIATKFGIDVPGGSAALAPRPGAAAAAARTAPWLRRRVKRARPRRAPAAIYDGADSTRQPRDEPARARHGPCRPLPRPRPGGPDGARRPGRDPRGRARAGKLRAWGVSGGAAAERPVARPRARAGGRCSSTTTCSSASDDPGGPVPPAVTYGVLAEPLAGWASAGAARPRALARRARGRARRRAARGAAAARRTLARQPGRRPCCSAPRAASASPPTSAWRARRPTRASWRVPRAARRRAPDPGAPGGLTVRLPPDALPGDAAPAADVAIVGAGPAGIVLALELAATGHDVLLLESGGAKPGAAVQQPRRRRTSPTLTTSRWRSPRSAGSAAPRTCGAGAACRSTRSTSRRAADGRRCAGRSGYAEVARYFGRACDWARCGAPVFDARELPELAGRSLVPGLEDDDEVRSTELERWSLPTELRARVRRRASPPRPAIRLVEGLDLHARRLRPGRGPTASTTSR